MHIAATLSSQELCVTLTNYEKINLPGNTRHIKNKMQRGLGKHYELTVRIPETEIIHTKQAYPFRREFR